MKEDEMAKSTKGKEKQREIFKNQETERRKADVSVAEGMLAGGIVIVTIGTLFVATKKPI